VAVWRADSPADSEDWKDAPDGRCLSRTQRPTSAPVPARARRSGPAPSRHLLGAVEDPAAPRPAVQELPKFWMRYGRQRVLAQRRALAPLGGLRLVGRHVGAAGAADLLRGGRGPCCLRTVHRQGAASARTVPARRRGRRAAAAAAVRVHRRVGVDAAPAGDLGAALVGRQLLYWGCRQYRRPDDGWQRGRGTVARLFLLAAPLPARRVLARGRRASCRGGLLVQRHYTRQTPLSAQRGTADSLLNAASYGARWVPLSPATVRRLRPGQRRHGRTQTPGPPTQTLTFRSSVWPVARYSSGPPDRAWDWPDGCDPVNAVRRSEIEKKSAEAPDTTAEADTTVPAQPLRNVSFSFHRRVDADRGASCRWSKRWLLLCSSRLSVNPATLIQPHLSSHTYALPNPPACDQRGRHLTASPSADSPQNGSRSKLIESSPSTQGTRPQLLLRHVTAVVTCTESRRNCDSCRLSPRHATARR
jgi:hypothetical protein